MLARPVMYHVSGMAGPVMEPVSGILTEPAITDDASDNLLLTRRLNWLELAGAAETG